MKGASVQVDNAVALAAFEGMAAHLRDMRPLLRSFHAYHAGQTDRVFDALGRGGANVYRGLNWKPFKPSALPHARKRPGRSLVQGGAPNTSAQTLGHRRPSGKRLNARSLLLQDTGALRESASDIQQLTRTSILYGSRLPYADEQGAARPWLVFTKSDADVLLRMTRDALVADLTGRLRGEP